MKNGQDNGKKLFRMIDTAGGHYRILLETRKSQVQVYSWLKMIQEFYLSRMKMETCVPLNQ